MASPGLALDTSSQSPPALDVPSRYRVVSGNQGGARAVVSGNATNIVVHVARGLVVDRRTRKRYPPRTIFLDGAYHGAPFCDNAAQHYSLDHHDGCVRGFTLATCEQAAVMILQGLPLSKGTWNVYVNDPDLDSVLAAWVLVNHLDLLRDERALLRRVMPLLRLEGVIDAHGTDFEVLAGLEDAVLKKTRADIDALMARERELKRNGAWQRVDWAAYVKDAFDAIDRLVIPHPTLEELLAVQEAGRAAVGESTAVLVRSKEGIYAIEDKLKARYGKYLGVIVLDQGGGRFTLRQVDSFLRKDLTHVYRALNKIDPRADPNGDPPNAWGGAGNIGGSPRATGTGLDAESILLEIERTLGPEPSFWQWLIDALLNRQKPPSLPRALPPTDEDP